MPLRDEPPDELKRLPAAWYQGHAWVHWTMTIQGRKRGWLDATMHSQVRELMLHTCHRHELICAGYCLMPDHAHFLFMGISETADQIQAMEFFRRAWNRLLRDRGVELQRQAHDHVLVESERNPQAFEDVVLYILNNPVRASLVEEREEWPYLGAVAAGYPDLDPREWKGWWSRFWSIHNKETTANKNERPL